MSIREIIIQFIGFLTQVLPVAILCLVPFPDNELCLSRKKLTLFFSGCMIVLAMGYGILSFFIFRLDGSHSVLMRQTSNLYMLVCVILWLIAVFRCIRSDAIKKIMVVVLMIYYAAALFSLNSIMLAPIGHNNLSDNVYGTTTVVNNVILLAITCPFLYLFLVRDIRFGISHMESRSLKRNCLYMVFSLLLFFVCVFSLSTFKFYYGFSDMSVALFLMAFILTDCILFFILFTEVRLTAQNRQLEEQLRSFNDQYRQINDNIARARRERHDMRHHLNMITTMNHQGEQRKLEEYLQSYGASFLELEQMSLCGYPAFDNILQYYIEYAGKYGIKVETELQTLRESLDFDVIDLTVMLGNLMENAIEACERLPSDAPRLIRIWAKRSDVVFLLKIENSCCVSNDDQPEFTGEIRFTSTKHAIGNGQGLKSIQYAAEKYGGSAEFRKADGMFTARIVMNIP